MSFIYLKETEIRNTGHLQTFIKRKKYLLQQQSRANSGKAANVMLRLSLESLYKQIVYIGSLKKLAAFQNSHTTTSSRREKKKTQLHKTWDFHRILRDSSTINKKAPSNIPQKPNPILPYHQKPNLKFRSIKRQQRQNHTLPLKSYSQRLSRPYKTAVLTLAAMRITLPFLSQGRYPCHREVRSGPSSGIS